VSRNLRTTVERSTEIIPSNSPSNRNLYRAVRPFAATRPDDGRILIVQKGALLIIESPLKRFGLMQALCAEQTLLVFTRDIESCAECVDIPPFETI
jgi:hypothetical protein